MANTSKKNDSFGLVNTISSYTSDTTGTSVFVGIAFADVPGGYNLIPCVNCIHVFKRKKVEHV